MKIGKTNNVNVFGNNKPNLLQSVSCKTVLNAWKMRNKFAAADETMTVRRKQLQALH